MQQLCAGPPFDFRVFPGEHGAMNRTAIRPLSPRERRDRLRLIRSENVGPITFFQFLRRFGSAEAALAALPELAQRGGRRKALRICAEASAEAEIEATERAGARLLIWGEPDYPSPLAAVEDAPPVVSVRGDVGLLHKRMVAVVGARNASANGRRFARKLAHELGEGGLVVVSGLARGIDAEAHEGALASGTVAVVAGGVDVIYPGETAALHERIAADGVIIAEQPPGTEPTARHFPRRNRMISGLSLGVVVVEAAPRSGSLITARLALEQGRDVFAVPGSPLDPRARGANDLIRNGAALTESAEDVLRALETPLRIAPVAEPTEIFGDAAPSDPLDDVEILAIRDRLADRLGPTPIPIDELVRQLGAAPAAVNAALLELELAGRLERHPGGQVSIISD